MRASRSPHGERGLKYSEYGQFFVSGWSLSSWRAWIEIELKVIDELSAAGRSPHGERGLKSHCAHHAVSFSKVALLMESVD